MLIPSEKLEVIRTKDELSSSVYFFANHERLVQARRPLVLASIAINEMQGMHFHDYGITLGIVATKIYEPSPEYLRQLEVAVGEFTAEHSGSRYTPVYDGPYPADRAAAFLRNDIDYEYSQAMRLSALAHASNL